MSAPAARPDTAEGAAGAPTPRDQESAGITPLRFSFVRSKAGKPDILSVFLVHVMSDSDVV
jgi:hypothetical protein